MLYNPHRNKTLGPYISFNEKKGNGKRISSAPHTDLFKFVNKAIGRYREAFTDAACCPVLRIDVFKRQDGRFVVNEVEHLEAEIEAAVLRGEPINWKGFLREFWRDQLEYMIKKYYDDVKEINTI